MTKEQKWFALCVAFVFIAGFIAGNFTGPLIMRAYFRPPGFGDGGRFGKMPMGPDRMRPDKMQGEDFVARFSQELSLNKTQQDQLKKIFDANEPEMRATRQEMKDNLEKFRAKMDAQIMGILDEKQKVKFKEITKRFEEHEMMMHENVGPGEGMGHGPMPGQGQGGMPGQGSGK